MAAVKTPRTPPPSSANILNGFRGAFPAGGSAHPRALSFSRSCGISPSLYKYGGHMQEYEEVYIKVC